MIPINTTFAPLQALVDELVRCGMTHAVTCPGSRNAPIALTLAAQEGLTAISVLDERSAGFVALGIAKHSGRPVAITTTSGTAAANLMPAVVEAHEAQVPLIVLTADRPPELREVGAGQAIDQIKLYGSFAKWFVEVGNLAPGRPSAIHHRQLGCRAYATAALGRPGPVHLNIPLREPLAPRTEQLDPADWEGCPSGEPWTRAGEAPLGGELVLNDPPERGVVVCGGAAGEYGPAALHLAHRLGWPVLAEPTSGVRSGTDKQGRTNVIAHYDLLVRSEAFASERPDVVIRVGEMPTSKPLRAWLEGCRQIVIDPHFDWHDPTRSAESIMAVGPEALAAAATEDARGDNADARRDTTSTRGGQADAPGGSADAPDGRADASDGRAGGAWLARWLDADAIVAEELARSDEPFEPLAYNVLADLAELIWVSSSLPIRDFESYFPRTDRPLTILSNRGANGIDGVVSSAVGASISAGKPAYLVIGELALLHDIGGLVSARRAGAELAILCVNNGGGGIFDFLPVAEQADREPYEDHIATPVDFDVATAARLGGLEHRRATTAAEVREHLRPGALVEFIIDRPTSLQRHRDLAARIVKRLDTA
jgi:2-succinyl-5-enolpyruvyl-6-hydroxy-3-cyclohexene-1-carboxylate synthase